MKKVYVVKPGDSVPSIAKKLQVTISELVQFNKVLRVKGIKVGDILVIPESSPIFRK